MKVTKINFDAVILDMDDGNASGRSSDCYEGNFGCSPSSVSRVPTVSSSPPETVANPPPCLEHLVMAIEQLEGPPGSSNSHLIEKPAPMNDTFACTAQGQTLYYSVSDLRSFPYGIGTTDSNMGKQNINSFAEEFDLISAPSNLQPSLIPACEDKGVKEMPMNDYNPVGKLLNRPIPYKYHHRPQVVVNNSH